MKNFKRLLASVLCAALASQGMIAAVNVSAATTVSSGKSVSLDFEEYEENALPSGGWAFIDQSKLPANTTANDFFKVKTIKNADGEDTKALVFESSQPGTTEEQFKDKASARYTFDTPITGNYIEADYDILVKGIGATGNGYYGFMDNGYTMSDTEGKSITNWGSPIGADNAFYYNGAITMGFPKYLADQGKYDTSQNPRFALNKMGTDGQWVNVKKIYNINESTYSLWVDGAFKGTYDLGTITGSGVSANNGTIGGLSSFYISFTKDVINQFDVCAAVDNLKVTKLTDYVPGMISYDFETDRLGKLPSGMTVNPNALGVAANDEGKNIFYKVAKTTGYDGTPTKALYFKSQPTEGTEYIFGDGTGGGSASTITFSFDKIKSKYVEVSYDVKIEQDESAKFSAGFIAFKGDEKETAETVWGAPVNTEWVYKDVNAWNWKITKFDNSNYDGGKVYNSDGSSKWIRNTRVYDLENHTYSLYIDGVETVKDQPMIGVTSNKKTETSEAVSIGRFGVNTDLRAKTAGASVSYYIDNVYAKPVDYKHMPKNYSFSFENEAIGSIPKGWTADSKISGVSAEQVFSVQETTDKNGLETKALMFDSSSLETVAATDFPRIQYNNINIESGIIEASFDVKVEEMGDAEGADSFSGGVTFKNASGNEAQWGQPSNKITTYNYRGTKTYNEMGNGTRVFAKDENGGYTVPKWTSFRFVYNLNNHTYSVYVDEVLKQSDVKMNGAYANGVLADSTATMASNIMFLGSKTYKSKWYVDNVYVKEIIPEKVDNIYVAPDGDDANSGYSDDQPITLETAKKLAKDATLYTDLVTVHLAAGTYTGTLNLTAAESPADGKKIIYKAEGDVDFTGEYAIDASKFTKTTLADGKIYSADISGIDSLNEKNDYAFGSRDSGLYYGLVQNNTLMTLAKYPNFGYITTAESDVNVTGEANNYTAELAIPAEKAALWANANDIYVEGYFWGNWGYYGNGANVNDGKLVLGGLSNKFNFPRYTVSNLLEELDIPGEYYIDRANKKLYYYPIDENLDGISLVTDENAKIRLDGAKNIELDGINVKRTKGNAYKVVNSNNITINNAEIANVYAPYAIDISGSTNITIDNAKIHDLPAGGIYTDGGKALKDFTNGEIKIINSEIYNFARERKTYYPAVSLNGCGNTVSNCVIHDAPHSAIMFTGNDHVIEYCDISNVVTESLDAGAIYGGRSWVSGGTEIRYNNFHDITRFPVAKDDNRVMGVFFDDMLCGNKVIGNMFNNVSVPVGVSGGKGVEITDNVMTNCDNGITYTNPNSSYTAGYRETYEAFKAANFVDDEGNTNAKYDAWLEKYPYLTLIDSVSEFDNYVTNGVITGNVISGTDAADFKAASTLSKVLYENAADYENTYENNIVAASYDGTATWNKISAEIAKVGANVSKTTVVGATISLISATNTADGVQFVWFNHGGIGLEELIVADNSEFNNPVAEIYSNFNGAVVTGLERGKTYYWKAVAKDSFGNIAESEVATFKLDALKLGTIELDKAPAAGETVTAAIPVDMADGLEGTVIAVYRAGGKTVAVSTAALTNETTTIATAIPADADGEISAEFYFWNSLAGMTPLADAVNEYKVNETIVK